MKLTVPRLGLDEVEVDPASLIEFPNGLPGFENCRQFKLFHSEDNPAIFWLLSIDDPDVVFSIAGPESLGVFYKMTLTDEELATLQAGADDLLQVAILLGSEEANGGDKQQTIQAYYESPLIINVSKQLALQKMLHFDNFSIDAYAESKEQPEDSCPSIPDASQIRPKTSFAIESALA